MLDLSERLEAISCPLCRSINSRHWGAENGYTCQKCSHCGLVYVSPRPRLEDISDANKIGEHSTATDVLNVVFKRSASKARGYARLIRSIFPDIVASTGSVSWLDVGAGYGEVIEALQSALPEGSRVIGIEPMAPKVAAAQRRNLPVFQRDIDEITDRYDVISLINVFSHIPDFRVFLERLRDRLAPRGEIFIETGNGGDLQSMAEYPDLLYLPDHLIFAGEEHVKRYLSECGFSIVSVTRERFDTALWFAKALAKKALGRKVKLGLPYRSRFRRIFFRARL